MIILTKISLVIAGILLFGGCFQYIIQSDTRKKKQYILDCVVSHMEQEKIRSERQLALEKEEEELQKSKVFYLNVKITHGSAFGGFCATKNDGRRKRGYVPLDQILLYGRYATGKEFTYYIEEQGIEICAMDDPDKLLIRSKNAKFEIRQNGQSKDEGVCVQNVVITKDVLYYIILESKHEITIKAVKGC